MTRFLFCYSFCTANISFVLLIFLLYHPLPTFVIRMLCIIVVYTKLLFKAKKCPKGLVDNHIFLSK